MFYNPIDFPFSAPLRAAWRDIYKEYQGIRESMADWVERDLYDEGWKVFRLFDFPHGEPIADNIARCPVTADLVQRWIPNHGAAGFSVLQPMAHLNPHEGYQGNFLRCHLGLKVPDGDCVLRVLDDTRHWQEGEVMVFDDRVMHEAWNNTAEERVIMLVDFVPEH